MAVARRICKNEEDARDALQSAYLSAFRAVQRFEGTCQLSTWLHRIVVNMALMRLRTRRRKPEEQMEALLPSFQEDGHHVEQFSEWAMPADRLLERAHEIADIVNSNAPLAVRGTRLAIHKTLDLPLHEAEILAETFRERVLRTEDANEGPRAFMEKRKPVFSGK